MLRVIVVCEDCHRQIELVVEDDFDIADVSHDCDAERAYDVVRADGAQARLAAVG